MSLAGQIHALTLALGYALLHFLWQGALAGVACALGLNLVPRRYARARYSISLTTLLMMFVLPIITFCTFYSSPAATSHAALAPLHTRAAAAEVPALAQSNLIAPIGVWLKPWLTSIVALWLAGVVTLSLRMALGWRSLRRYRCSARFDLPAHWLAALNRTCRKLRVRRRVRAARSKMIRSPAVIGWLRPLILIPPSALSGLTPQQVEMILAHELAHVRRYDYLVNLCQVVVETLLFYHPAVHWVSRQTRREREHCCDDLAVKTCGDARGYARALARLEDVRGRAPVFSFGLADGALVSRIERLVITPPAPASGAWLTGALAATILVGFMLLNSTGKAPTMPSTHIQLPVEQPFAIRAQAVDLNQPQVRQLVSVSSRSLQLPQQPPAHLPRPARTSSASTARASGAPQSIQHGASLAAAHPSIRSGLAPKAVQPSPHRSAVKSVPAQAKATPVQAANETAHNAEPGNRAAVNDTLAAARRHSSHPESGAPASTMKPHLSGGKPIRTSAPNYPRWAQERGREGSATVEFSVGTRGQVHNVRVITVTGGAKFGRAAAQTIRTWRFKPFKRDGVPVARTLKQHFNFQLKNKRHCRFAIGSRLCR